MRKGQRGKKVAPAPKRLALSPKDRLRQQAYTLRNARDFVGAKPLLAQLFELEPKDMPLALDYGEALMETEDFAGAVSLYAKLIEADPKNLAAVTNLGGALIRQGKLSDARNILEYALELDPKSIHARINLGSVLQASGERKANLDNALEAVQIDPSSSLAFNNLGSAFSDMAMFKEARHAYETAVMLDTEQIDALINLAAVEARLGDSKASAEMYERVIKKLPKEAEQRIEATKFYAAFEYLKQGNLEKGWDYYEGGFSPLVPASGARSPRRTFDVPRWDGQPLNGKTLLVWREQGLGDELLFYTCLHDLKDMGGKVIVECDKRLVEVMARSFPELIIRAELFMPQKESRSPLTDFDYHLPAGSLMRYFRPTIESFNRSGAYIKPDPAKVAKFEERLAPYKDDYRLVGICWRSGKLDPVRNLSYTVLDEWGEVLQTQGFKFVNLQYGDCETELREAEEKYGIEILRWPNLNMRDDLDELFALMTCLDVVASVQTAVLTMAGSIGVPTVGLKVGGWVYFGQRTNSRWFPYSGASAKTNGLMKAIDELNALVTYGLFDLQNGIAKNHKTWQSIKKELKLTEVENLLEKCLNKEVNKHEGLRLIIFIDELLKLRKNTNSETIKQKIKKFIDDYCEKNNTSPSVRENLIYRMAYSTSYTSPTKDDASYLYNYQKSKPVFSSLHASHLAKNYFIAGLIESAKLFALDSLKSTDESLLFDNEVITILAASDCTEEASTLVGKLIQSGYDVKNLSYQLASGLRMSNNQSDAFLVLDKVQPLDTRSAQLSVACASRFLDRGNLQDQIDRHYQMGTNDLRGLYSTAIYYGMDRFNIEVLVDWCNLDISRKKINLLTLRCINILEKLTETNLFNIDLEQECNQINSSAYQVIRRESIALEVIRGNERYIDSLSKLYKDELSFQNLYHSLAHLDSLGLDEITIRIDSMYRSSLSHRNAYVVLAKALRALGRFEGQLCESIYKKDFDCKRYVECGFLNRI